MYPPVLLLFTFTLPLTLFALLLVLCESALFHALTLAVELLLPLVTPMFALELLLSLFTPTFALELALLLLMPTFALEILARLLVFSLLFPKQNGVFIFMLDKRLERTRHSQRKLRVNLQYSPRSSYGPLA